MGTEIERKFLVASDHWRSDADEGVSMRQGYMRASDATLRVRIAGATAWFTIKGRTTGVTRGEWEWTIPTDDAADLLEQFCGTRVVAKTRYTLEVGRHEWVVDVFEGRHEGLVLAEIELDAADERFERPAWLGDEVSGDSRYYNERLASD